MDRPAPHGGAGRSCFPGEVDRRDAATATGRLGPLPPPPAGWGRYPPGYGYQPPRTCERATWVLGTGVGSLVMFFTCFLGFVPAIVTLFLAPGAKREIAQ